MTLFQFLAFVGVAALAYLLLRNVINFVVWLCLAGFVIFTGFYLFLGSSYFPFELPAVVTGAMRILGAPFVLMGNVLRDTFLFIENTF